MSTPIELELPEFPERLWRLARAARCQAPHCLATGIACNVSILVDKKRGARSDKSVISQPSSPPPPTTAHGDKTTFGLHAVENAAVLKPSASTCQMHQHNRTRCHILRQRWKPMRGMDYNPESKLNSHEFHFWVAEDGVHAHAQNVVISILPRHQNLNMGSWGPERRIELAPPVSPVPDLPVLIQIASPIFYPKSTLEPNSEYIRWCGTSLPSPGRALWNYQRKLHHIWIKGCIV